MDATAIRIFLPNVFSLIEAGSRALLSLGNGIALIHPVRTEIVEDIKYLHVGKTERVQGIVGRLDVRAVAPRTTATINNDEPASGESLYTFTQLLYAALAGSRADVLRTGNMCLLVKHVGANLDHEWLFVVAGLEGLDWFFRLDQLRAR